LAPQGRVFFRSGLKKQADGENEKDTPSQTRRKNVDREKRIKSWFFRCQFPAFLDRKNVTF
jgi:hypothetical protein